MFSPGSIWKKNMRVINLHPQAEQNFGSGLITLNYIESANVDIQYLDRMITPLWCLTTIWGQTWTNGFQWFVSSSLNLLNACRPQGAMSLFRRVSDMLWSQWKAGQTFMFRPNQPNVEQGGEVSHRSLGGLYHGKYEKVINNNKARLVWEARFSFVSQCSNRICCGFDCCVLSCFTYVLS